MKSRFIAIAAIALTGCAGSMPPSPGGPTALAVASCPPLTPLAEDSFGATTVKLIEVAGIYHRCRAAALAGQQRPPQTTD